MGGVGFTTFVSLLLLLLVMCHVPTTLEYPQTCREIWASNSLSSNGWYVVDPLLLSQPFWVWCDIYHGGWTRVEALAVSQSTGAEVPLPLVPTTTDPLMGVSYPDNYPELQNSFEGWGSPPSLQRFNLTYNVTTTGSSSNGSSSSGGGSGSSSRLTRLRSVATQALQSVYFHCRARQVNATYGCTVDPKFYPTHVGRWKDWWFQGIAPTVLNDGCCFGCCRNVGTRWDHTLLQFTQLAQLPILNVEVRHSGAPGEWWMLEPGPLWLL